MDELFTTLLSANFILLALGSAALTQVVKSFSEYFLNRLCNSGSLFWKSAVLPSLPIILGVCLALVSGESLLLGLVSGLSSGLIFRIFKSFLKKKLT